MIIDDIKEEMDGLIQKLLSLDPIPSNKPIFKQLAARFLYLKYCLAERRRPVE